MTEHWIPYALGAVALVVAIYKLKVRLELSKAKHPSLRGHARIGLAIARLVPFYEYDEQRIFNSDGAPTDVADRRRAGFMRLAKLYDERFAETRKLTEETAAGLSDLQFTAAYRVPFQYSRFVRKHLRIGATDALICVGRFLVGGFQHQCLRKRCSTGAIDPMRSPAEEQRLGHCRGRNSSLLRSRLGGQRQDHCPQCDQRNCQCRC